MSKNSEINWGILGTARIAREKMIAAIQQSTGNKCIAIASRSKIRAKEFSQEFCIPKYYYKYEEVINDSEIDAVYIPLPNSLHYEWVIRAAEKGKHVLCEKPLGINLTQVREMINVCNKQKVVLLEAFSYYLHPQYEILKRLLKKETIGRIISIYVNFSFIAQKKHAIRFNPQLGGGSFLDIGCYGIDIINHLYNQEPKYIETLYKVRKDIDVEFLGILKFENNRDAIIKTSFFQERQQTLLLSGEKGAIFLPNAFIPKGNKVFFFIKTRSKSLTVEIGNIDQYGLLVRKFRKLVLSKHDMNDYYQRLLRNALIIDQILKTIKH